MKAINLFGYTITIRKQDEGEPFPSADLTGQLLSKLPDFNYEWSPEAQINWLNMFGQLHDMAIGQKTKDEPEALLHAAEEAEKRRK